MDNASAVEFHRQTGRDKYGDIYPEYFTDVLHRITHLRTIRRENLSDRDREVLDNVLAVLSVAWERLDIAFMSPGSEAVTDAGDVFDAYLEGRDNGGLLRPHPRIRFPNNFFIQGD
mgnify:FL=1|tara:strand:+ start:269 stop:616 length:348 start_codon:yes stop_codon:yes gene_type:complete